MSDERKCFAGDLGTDQLDRFVTVQVGGGTVITDRIWSVTHQFGDDGGPDETLVHFVNVPDPRSRNGFSSSGWKVDPETEVTVLPDEARTKPEVAPA